ncbi:hypothetical protein K438DRAFT_2030415, partial [Mycena galopus ATCC 62051]
MSVFLRPWHPDGCATVQCWVGLGDFLFLTTHPNRCLLTKRACACSICFCFRLLARCVCVGRFVLCFVVRFIISFHLLLYFLLLFAFPTSVFLELFSGYQNQNPSTQSQNRKRHSKRGHRMRGVQLRRCRCQRFCHLCYHRVRNLPRGLRARHLLRLVRKQRTSPLTPTTRTWAASARRRGVRVRVRVRVRVGE